MTLILDGCKLQWHKDRIEAWQRGELFAPVTIDMALSRACNYKCSYCYGQLQENEIKPLTWPVLVRFLDDAKEIGVKAISLVSDGESTCHKNWTDFIVAGKSRGIDMAIGTNGYNISSEDLEKVLPMLTYIRFNISAATPERYQKIHGTNDYAFFKVMRNIMDAVDIKRKNKLPVTIGIQMVLLPEFADQIIKLAILGKVLGVDYFVIKHCSDDENGALGVDYSKYQGMAEILKQAEAMSTANYQVAVKWSKIMSGGKRNYSRCLAAPFIMQLSGSGLVAPCGMLFNDKYKKYHIGNIAETSFKELWQGERWKEVMRELASDKFNAKIMCGSLCLQHKCNEYLTGLRHVEIPIHAIQIEEPEHANFI